MNKFEEKIKGRVETMATQPGCSMTRKVWYNADDIHTLSNGWISPEDFEEISNALDQTLLSKIKQEKELEELKSQFENQKEIPAFVAVEIERLKNQGIKTLSELYEADIEWLAQGHNYLEGNNLAIAKWFCDNTEKFEAVWISWKTEEAEE